MPEWLNVSEYHLDRWTASGRGGVTAVVDLGTSRHYSYSELVELTSRTAKAFNDISLDPFDRIMIFKRDNVHSVLAFLGAMRAGMVPFFVNPNVSTEELKFYIRDSLCRLIIVDDSTRAKCMDAVKSDGKHVKQILNTDDKEYVELLTDSRPSLSPFKTHKDDPAYWVYTSGTTGKPKAAVHLHHDLLVTVRAYTSHVIDYRDKDLFYSASKLYFSAGRMFGLHIPLICGVSTLIDPVHTTPDRVFENLKRFDVTHFLGVPTLYSSTLNRLEALGIKELHHPTLRWCVAGGEQLPSPVFRRWKEVTGLEILNGIGSSEAEWIFISYTKGRIVPGSSGTLIPGWDAKLVDESGEEVREVGRVGTLHIRSDSVAAYYWRRCDDSKKTFLGEWYNTKDMLYIDGSGQYFYVGRSDDLFKVSGMWVSPVEVEDVILETGMFSEVAVIGAPSEEGLTKVVAYVVLKDDMCALTNEELLKALRTKLKGKLPEFKLPSKLVIVSELPKTPTGKLKRSELARAHTTITISRKGG
ncbi:MAG: benzoate-CoA ligase family protein [Nitrososphaerota archaeon]|nr:benzoate-CoA ligase family protein [Nitrososphaerota archaeon]